MAQLQEGKSDETGLRAGLVTAENAAMGTRDLLGRAAVCLAAAARIACLLACGAAIAAAITGLLWVLEAAGFRM